MRGGTSNTHDSDQISIGVNRPSDAVTVWLAHTHVRHLMHFKQLERAEVRAAMGRRSRKASRRRGRATLSSLPARGSSRNSRPYICPRVF